MMNLPLVSVIVPTYNRAGLLRLTIESVLAQTHPAVELIVVDDGSEDDTPALLAQYAGRLTAIHQRNQGGAAAANRGFEAASGSLITFLDHDDLIYPDKLARQVRVMQAQPHIDLCHCQHDFIDEHGEVLRRSGPLPGDDVLRRLLKGNFIWSGAPLIRRETLARVGLHDEENWCADWDLWLRMALAGCAFHCIQERLGAYRVVRSSQMSSAKRVEQHSEALLHKLFSRAGLPQAMAGMHDDALAQLKWYVSGLYFNCKQPAEGQRAIAEAMRLDPFAFADPAGLARKLCVQAFDIRVSDPVSYISYVFDHLPDEAGAVRAHRPAALACVCLGEAMRRHLQGCSADAKQLAQQARMADAAFADHIDDYDDFMAVIAHDLPLDDLNAALSDMFDTWGEPRVFGALRRRVLGQINIAGAFESYAQGRHRDTVQHVLSGLRQQPVAMTNRGVWSILARSLLRQPHSAALKM